MIELNSDAVLINSKEFYKTSTRSIENDRNFREKLLNEINI